MRNRQDNYSSDMGPSRNLAGFVLQVKGHQGATIRATHRILIQETRIALSITASMVYDRPEVIG
ncbi:hypothetical protein ACN4EG_08465 [Alkalinema pantanalense CENA528]|uniref:hypothetical protein n=1 Tax=Alkalinema pantanalense TaxID=1620705 RepID=UPI003D6F5E5E